MHLCLCVFSLWPTIGCLTKSFDVAVILLVSKGGHTDDEICLRNLAGCAARPPHIVPSYELSRNLLAFEHSLDLAERQPVCFGKYFSLWTLCGRYLRAKLYHNFNWFSCSLPCCSVFLYISISKSILQRTGKQQLYEPRYIYAFSCLFLNHDIIRTYLTNWKIWDKNVY